MRYLHLEGLPLPASNIVMGCMRINRLSVEEAGRLIRTEMELGVNFFDHADIYGGGECETHFGRALPLLPSVREKIILQSKCGICKGYYDSSKEHILRSVEGSLRRLGTDYLDVLLLHRPDTLMEPEEVAEAFLELHQSGKVRSFGVSNHNPAQIELLQAYLPQKLRFNQLQLSCAHTPLLDEGLAVNMGISQSVVRTGGALEYARLKGITIQAWSPFQRGFFGGPFLGDRENCGELCDKLDAVAACHGVTAEAAAIGFITRHPARMQVILGTTNLQRAKEAAMGSELPLTREEWYGIYQAAGNPLP